MQMLIYVRSNNRVCCPTKLLLYDQVSDEPLPSGGRLQRKRSRVVPVCVHEEISSFDSGIYNSVFVRRERLNGFKLLECDSDRGKATGIIDWYAAGRQSLAFPLFADCLQQ